MSSEDVPTIVVGTYDGYLYGWDGAGEVGNHDNKADAGKSYSLSFGYAAHTGCVKSIAVTRTRERVLMVTGGTDETIRIYNLSKKTEFGSLVQHKGPITCLEFFRSSHLLSGSTDGTVCIWRTSDWQCLHILGGHKAAVNSLSIHPSGKMALTVSRDRTMRVWNLVKGRCAYIKRLEREGSLILWSPDGSSYAIVCDKRVFLYTINGELSGSIEFGSRINSIVYLSTSVLACGCEDGKILVHSTGAGKVLGVIQTVCGTRVKDLKALEPTTHESSQQPYLVAAFSTGEVEIWTWNMENEEGHFELLASFAAAGSNRITSLCVANLKTAERKRSREEVTETVRTIKSDKAPEATRSRKRKSVVKMEFEQA